MATVGRTCVIPDDLEPGIITKHIYRITPERQVVLPHYLHLALWGAPAVREQMFVQVVGQTRPGLNGGIIRKLAIPLPPRIEQIRIVETADRLLSFRDQALTDLSATSLRVQRLRQAILKWAFEGRLVDQDPDDEPTEKLLARIRAERAAVSPTQKRTGRKARRGA
jgi:type I restriction enzyme S subunit